MSASFLADSPDRLKLVSEDFSGVNGCACHSLLLFPFAFVIVDNLDIRWTGLVIVPLKTDPPLVVDPNGILSLAGALQGFQAVGVECCQIAKRAGCVQNPQALLGLTPEGLSLADHFAEGKAFGVPVAIACYHPVLV